MPPVSEAQRKWAFANKDKNTKEGKAAAEYAAADPGGKLPARKSKGKVDRSSHFKGNPGFPSKPPAGTSPYMAQHEAREKQVLGAGYAAHEKAERSGGAHRVGGGGNPLRMSGHKGAHRLGRRS